MGSRINRIVFQLLPPKPTDYPLDPVVHIRVGSHSVGNHGEIYLSPQLMTHREIDEWINGLKADLEHVRKAAKKSLDKAKADQLEHIRQRQSKHQGGDDQRVH